MVSKFKKIFRLVKYRRPVFCEMGKGNKFSSNSVASAIATVGSWNYFGNNSMICNAKIGNYCSVAPNVLIGPAEHDYHKHSTSTFVSDAPIFSTPTEIGNDVWIAGNVVIRQGVSIGNGVVIGANSFVKDDLPDYSIAVGSPAKVIGYRFDETKRSLLDKSGWWHLKPEEAKAVLKNIEIARLDK